MSDAGNPTPSWSEGASSESPAFGSSPRFPDIPGYEIQAEVGKGGMGIVYLARQIALRRLVAIKRIRDTGLEPEDVSRFLDEAEAMARFSHPNLVTVHEVGRADGVPFFSMEYLDDGTLAQTLDRGPMAPIEAARLLVTLARAIHAAHSAGVVHRDLKPANVLLSADGTPKIGDFGLARRLEGGPGRTQTGAILGTPGYMAPEQATGVKGVGPAADIYALGAILYECLIGRPPFRAATPFETLMQGLTVPPVPPRRLNPAIPADLETIVLKCLEKEPRRRYASAEALADDLQRFLDGRPITARPIGPIELAWRWARRNRGLAAGLLAAVLFLVLGSVVSTLFALQARYQAGLAEERLGDAQRAEQAERVQRRVAEQRRSEARRTVYLSNLRLAAETWERGEVGTLRALLDSVRPEPDEPDRRGFEWYYLDARARTRPALALSDGDMDATAVLWSGDGKPLIASQGDGTVTLWDVAQKRLRHTLFADQETPGRIGAGVRAQGGHFLLADIVVWGPAGRSGRIRSNDRLLAISDDAGPLIPTAGMTEEAVLARLQGKPGTTVRLRVDGKGRDQPETVALVRRCEWVPSRNLPIALDPGGRWLATGNGSIIRLWSLTDGQEIAAHRGGPDSIDWLAFSSDGQTLYTATTIRSGGTLNQPSRIHALDPRTGKEKEGLPLANTPRALALVGGDVMAHQGRESLALASLPGAKAPRTWPEIPNLSADILTGSLNGHLLASGNYQGEVKVIDAEYGKVRYIVAAHRGQVTAAAFSPDGAWLATGGKDELVSLREAATGLTVRVLSAGTYILSLAFTADNTHLAIGTLNGVQVWDLRTVPGTRSADPQRSLLSALAFTPDGRELIVGGGTPGTYKDDSQTDRHGPDGNPSLTRWTTDDLTPTPVSEKLTAAVLAVAVSPDGKRIATGSTDRKVRIWERVSGQLLHTLSGHDELVVAVAFSPDGGTLASGGGPLPIVATRSIRPGEVLLWDVLSGELRTHCPAPDAGVTDLAFSPDGATLAVGVHQRQQTLGGNWTAGRVELRDAQTGRPRAHFQADDHAQGPVMVFPWKLAFSPDGRSLATVGLDEPAPQSERIFQTRLWDLSTRQTRAVYRVGAEPQIYCVAYAPDSRSIAIGTDNGTVRLLHAETAEPLLTLTAEVGRPVRCLAFSPDGRSLAAGLVRSQTGRLRIWHCQP